MGRLEGQIPAEIEEYACQILNMTPASPTSSIYKWVTLTIITLSAISKLYEIIPIPYV